MDFKNLLPAKNRDELRQWLLENHNKESECWVVAKRERSVGNGTFRENDNLWFRDRRITMAATIIYLVISLLVSLIFIILGVRQYKAEKPVSINTGEKPPCEDELTSVTEWNHRHGRNIIIFGCVLFITLAVFAYFIEKQDSIALQVVILLIMIFVEIAWVELQHNMMKKKMIKK